MDARTRSGQRGPPAVYTHSRHFRSMPPLPTDPPPHDRSRNSYGQYGNSDIQSYGEAQAEHSGSFVTELGRSPPLFHF